MQRNNVNLVSSVHGLFVLGDYISCMFEPPSLKSITPLMWRSVSYVHGHTKLLCFLLDPPIVTARYTENNTCPEFTLQTILVFLVRVFLFSQSIQRYNVEIMRYKYQGSTMKYKYTGIYGTVF